MELSCEAFQKWLHKRQDNGNFAAGYTYQANCCPIATWLIETGNIDNVFVERDFIYMEEEKMVTPSWAARFIALINKKGVEREISTFEALDALSIAIEEDELLYSK